MTPLRAFRLPVENYDSEITARFEMDREWEKRARRQWWFNFLEYVMAIMVCAITVAVFLVVLRSK